MRRPLLVGLALSLAMAGEAVPPAGQDPAGREGLPPVGRVPPTRADFDLFEIRDIFRYGDDPAPGPLLAPGSTGGQREGELEAAPIEAVPRVRLVGIVRRADRLLAALSIDGEVVLLDEAQTAAEFTVLDVTDDGVRFRGPEGEEETLRLP